MHAGSENRPLVCLRLSRQNNETNSAQEDIRKRMNLLSEILKRVGIGYWILFEMLC